MIRFCNKEKQSIGKASAIWKWPKPLCILRKIPFQALYDGHKFLIEG